MIKEKEIQPYTSKKPKIVEFQYLILASPEPENLLQARRRDIAWMISCATVNITPMWHGWNALMTVDTLPKQVLSYMEPIGKPPTRLDVVQETMNIAMQVAKECNEDYMPVTYDLAIAKPALQIQSAKAPDYKKLFICFGPFHIKLAIFRALGYLLNGSGGDYVLVESGVLALGSLNGVIQGTFYNRAKRFHSLLATAFRIKHLEYFLQVTETSIEPVKDLLQHLLEEPTCVANVENSDVFTDFVKQYEQFSKDTLDKKHGLTAKFWLQNCTLVEDFQLFSRAIRTNDLDLLIYGLEKMIPLFFATGLHNYSKWMTLYLMNLLNMDQTHPGLKEKLLNGALTISRSNKSFSRTEIDLTLEQTVNADAASRLTGIASMTQNINARRQWNFLRSTRSQIVSTLMDRAGLTVPDETHQELKPTRIKRDAKDLGKIQNAIDSTLNPFSIEQEKETLYCISSGKAASAEVANDLSKIREIGEQWSQEFRDQCNTDGSRFEKPIKRRKIKNFTHDAIKMKVPCKDKRIVELKGTKDLFGRLLYLAVTAQVDLLTVFSYPLTPVPFSLGNIDGSMSSTAKAALLKKLESKIDSSPPETVDVMVIDAMFIIRSLTNLPPTFKGIAQNILSIVCRTSAKEVHLVTDRYDIPSIKGMEQKKRETSNSIPVAYLVSGPDQTRPKEFNKALSSSTFKTALLEFLRDEWKKDSYCELLKHKTLFYPVKEKCYMYTVISGHMDRQECPELCSDHIEADTRIVQHISYIADAVREETMVVIRANDTDILVILLYHAATSNKLKLHMEIGTSTNNTRRFIEVSKLAMELGRTLCEALPGLHAFTGCDYSPAFKGKGKVRPLSVMEKSEEFTGAFGRLGAEKVVEQTHDRIESFVCTLYGQNVDSVNVTRHRMFLAKYQPNNSDLPLNGIKGMEASSMPPCYSALHQQIQRANYIATMWKNADKPVMTLDKPEENGWTLEDEVYRPLWYSCEAVPSVLIDNNLSLLEQSDDIGDDDDIRAGIPSLEINSSDEDDDDDDE